MCKHSRVIISDSIMLCKFRAECASCGKASAWVKTTKQALKGLRK